MKRFRQLLLLVLFLAAVATLSACSNKQTDASSDRVTITFWHGMTGERKTELNQMISDFNKSQSKYKVVGSSQGDFAGVQQKITAAAKSKTLPTIAQTTYTNVPNYVKGGFVTSFDPYISKSDLSDIYPAFLQATMYQGKRYSMPFSKSARILFYNKDLLKQEGLSVPTTWADIQNDGERLKAKGITAMAFDQSFVSELDGLTYQSGSQLLSSKPTVDSKQTLAATHVIWDMLQEGTATTAGTDGYGSTKFFAGKTLFYSGSSAAISTIQASTPKGMHWGTATLPSYQGKQATGIAGNDIVMFKSASTAQRKGSAAFVKYLMSNKQTIKWAEKTGYVPLTKSAQKDAGYQSYLAKNPTAKAASESLSFGFQDQAFLGYEQYLAALNKAVGEMTANQVTPEKSMTQLQQQVEKIVK
ncbi:sugar ABC transporter substrate-binding protein [Paucilactobacillus hokkaidonensis JCM 18461]|uniref:Sugar ABC transporter substrate-binding protein n=2 Tax=Paucilactobacillus hokkaidonensis TaxID=1193095 RepID=A0A0A1GRR3_9LACO|nr:ABC transporter substrate-binding protein [Paucilactobacillus hokkaidonensis]KRO07972.1 sugar ABC transporter substrate-binding protein [Paucilactobacillus hokkaidonensis]BAP84635.1 sugar ABC transporter substrate-binding protein [Paucilactobacillus hokkaidonensis JCM 18461]